MNKIKAETIEQAVYNLCVQANTCYDTELYNKLYDKYLHADSPDKRNKYANILENISLASKIKRPLCQDTGQVLSVQVIFVEQVWQHRSQSRIGQVVAAGDHFVAGLHDRLCDLGL